MSNAKVWSVKEIRSSFLNFFESKGHKIVPSAPMVLKDDPTLMFTNAGMNQFKDMFLGINKPTAKRVADTQKCLRVSGKHNDLEEVGVDTYHHTMFEMLGNWSFGDYFKEEAIAWAWELLTEVYKIDTSRIYVTVFEGNSDDGLQADVEAENIWKKFIDPARILRCSKKDNFWEMGATGPCGPCSEIHVDIRSDEARANVDGLTLVNQDHPQVIEIWNLVFMQFNRMADGNLKPLPAMHVDTGMGLERLAMVLQSKYSNYDTDVFQRLIGKLESISGEEYLQSDSKKDVAFRVIADHVRAVAFSIVDGQLPSNTGAGYVIRRILRRAVRYSYSFLNLKKPVMFQLIADLDELLGESFHELRAQIQIIEKVIKEEEESFLRTLSKGIERLNAVLISGNVTGTEAFELYDTFGFPIDLTQLIASEKDVHVDMVGFEQELAKQKERSRKVGSLTTSDWIMVGKDEEDKSEFVGYDNLVVEASQILKYRKVEAKGKSFYQLVLNKTPFYPEGGGQVGDTGQLVNGELRINIVDTQKENDLIVHKSPGLPQNLTGDWQAKVNGNKRSATTKNHSATHLLHHALREVLGKHVEQKGSLVKPEYLRFDFSHFQKLTTEELLSVEAMVNEAISSRVWLNEFRSIPIQEAKDKGAMSLFGEKYGDEVRMIQFGDSKELCGGTHVENTGDILKLKIQSESSVAAGIRRIEAITGDAVFDWFEKREQLLSEVEEKLGKPKQLVDSVQKLIDENIEQKKSIELFEKAAVVTVKSGLLNSVEQVNGKQFYSVLCQLNPKYAKDIAFQLKNKLNTAVVAIATDYKGKAGLTILITEDVLEAVDYTAVDLIKKSASAIQGGGGGQKFFATAGGKNVKGLQEALDKIKASI